VARFRLGALGDGRVERKNQGDWLIAYGDRRRASAITPDGGYAFA
jgi:hypothetical protein